MKSTFYRSVTSFLVLKWTLPFAMSLKEINWQKCIWYLDGISACAKASSGNKLWGHQRLCNDLIDVLAAINISWSPDLIESVSEKCIKVLVSSLWYIDAYHKQFYERSIHLPSVIDKLERYNWRAKRRKSLSLHLMD